MPVSALHKNDRIDHFKSVFAYATIGMLVTDRQGRIAAINPFALEEFGYSEKELSGKKIEVLIPARFHKKLNRYHEKYIENPHARTMGSPMDWFAIKKDGTEFPVEISFSSYQKDRDKYAIVFINDISARKKAEAEIEMLHSELDATVKQRTRELKQTLHQLEITNTQLEKAILFQKAILDNAGAMIIVTDEKGIIKLFNPEASHNTGYSKSEVIDRHSVLLFHDKKEIAGRRKELENKYGITTGDDFTVLVEKARRNIHNEVQYTCLRKDGTSFPVSLTITALRNNEGEVTGFMGIAIDISERKKAEENLREALEKEKGLGELKSRFVSMASHEFRTPLSTILSSAYLIEKYATTDDQFKREKHLQRIVSSVSLLTDILNDFLSVGRMEEGKMQTRFTRFPIRELVISIAEEMKSSLKKGQRIAYHHEGSPVVLLDASLLKHIVMNLVSNASKFSPEASDIEIKTISHHHYITLSVKDYGIGIAKDDQKHLMERFFRGANATTIQGTGLGLHIVSKYAELMNGKVDCQSEPGKGAEFIVTFNTKNRMT
ncbi:MAG: PAS domain S-box protein [Bacteroidota bacterium]|nr:PAS domain S-box protein [Bacteroidota bacterium]